MFNQHQTLEGDRVSRLQYHNVNKMKLQICDYQEIIVTVDATVKHKQTTGFKGNLTVKIKQISSVVPF